MAVQAGRKMLLKRGDGATPTEVFTTLGGIQNVEIAMSDEPIDVTDQNSNGFRKLLSDVRVNQKITIKGSGFTTGAPDERALFADWRDGLNRNFELIIEDVGAFKGPFRITELKGTGAHDDAQKYEMTLESAAEIAWTPEV